MSDWACGHDHQGQEEVEIILPGLYINTLCLLHREHVPCRKCNREADMIENLKTPEETFAAIQALLNHLDGFEGYDFGFQPPEPFSDEETGAYLLGRFNDDTGTMDVIQHLRYDRDAEGYVIKNGEPGE